MYPWSTPTAAAIGISSTLGSGSGVFRHGFQLNNMLGELDVIGIEPREAGTRLPSMMTPTLVLDEGGEPDWWPEARLCSPGGSDPAVVERSWGRAARRRGHCAPTPPR
jgi:gamma-glutamyltranspeptidase